MARNHILIAAQHNARLSYSEHMDLVDSMLATFREKGITEIKREQLAEALSTWAERNKTEQQAPIYECVIDTSDEGFEPGLTVSSKAQ